MKIIIAPLALVLVAACAGTAPGGSQISQLAGKTLISGADSFSYSTDGTMQGTFGGQPLTGIWREENGLFCRSGMLGDIEITDACQSFVVSGNTLTLTHVAGTQRVTTYTFDG